MRQHRQQCRSVWGLCGRPRMAPLNNLAFALRAGRVDSAIALYAEAVTTFGAEAVTTFGAEAVTTFGTVEGKRLGVAADPEWLVEESI